MKTPDQHELDAAWELCIDALQSIRKYTFDPGDFEAASVAVLCKAIELTAKKELILCFKQNSITSSNSKKAHKATEQSQSACQEDTQIQQQQ